MFKIGCDPELFLIDTETGKFVSAHGMIPGTKHEPHAVEYGAVQVDGMALEFNIDPVDNIKDWRRNINSVLGQLRGMVDKRYEFAFVPVANFGKEYIESQPDEAKMLGCDPDFNAWKDGEANVKPDGSMGIRTASGHIHIGWTEGQDISHPEHISACHMLVKQLDYFLGLPSVLWDKDRTRRTMYGDFGCYRPKHYGVEYRTMSNAWLADKDLRTYVFNNAMAAALRLMDKRRLYEKYAHPTTYDNLVWGTVGEGLGTLSSMKVALPLSFAKFSKEPRPHVVELHQRLDKEGLFINRHNPSLGERKFEEISQQDIYEGWTSFNAFIDASASYKLSICRTQEEFDKAYTEMKSSKLKKAAAKPWIGASNVSGQSLWQPVQFADIVDIETQAVQQAEF